MGFDALGLDAHVDFSYALGGSVVYDSRPSDVIRSLIWLPVVVLILSLSCDGRGSGVSLPGGVAEVEVLGDGVAPDVNEGGGTHETFAKAQLVDTPASGTIVVSGSLTAGDGGVDVYDLGPLAAGTQIIADVDAGGFIDADLILFDHNEDYLADNDDRNFEAQLYDPLIEHVMRRNTTSTYLMIQTSPFAEFAAGGYTIALTVLPDQEIPAPAGQTIVLDWDGASGTGVTGFESLTIPAFDAAHIDASFAGQTEAIIALVVAAVKNDFAGYGVTVTSTHEPPIEGGDVTTVFMGTSEEDLFGIANNIDNYNADHGDNAVVFTDSFGALMGESPTVAEMAQAIANVVTHETGHLLGLRHTTEDPTEIMQTTSTAAELLLDEFFGRARIDYSPLGYEHSIQRMADTVGFVASPPPRIAPDLEAAYEAAARRVQELGLPTLNKSDFGMCFCKKCCAGG
jgi:hypothetical protein